MNREETDKPVSSSELRDRVDTLYGALIDAFYEKEDPEVGRPIAAKLEETLIDRPDVADSIRGEEIRSLIAELNGDLQEAIRRRESEIRKILELHSLVWGKPGWAYLLRQYDHSDVSDRLDLLAGLYASLGDLDRAIATLRESKIYCAGHGIPFDGQDLLDEYEKDRESLGRGIERPREQSIRINNALRAAYKELGLPSDQVVADDAKLGRLRSSLKRHIPEVQMTMGEIRVRLLRLRKRGERRGGLPRLGVPKTRPRDKSAL